MTKIWRVYGEYADGYGATIIGKNKQHCIRRLVSNELRHGELEYYDGKLVIRNLYIASEILKTIIALASIIFLAWFVISYAEILAKNTTENPIYHAWNMFIYLANRAGENIPTI